MEKLKMKRSFLMLLLAITVTVLSGCTTITVEGGHGGDGGDGGDSTSISQNTSANANTNKGSSAVDEKAKQEALNTAQDSMDDEDYADALKTLDDALEEYPEDADLTELRGRAAEAYEKQVQDKVKEYTDKDDYDSALTELSKALEVLPDSEILKKLNDKTDKGRPDTLSSMAITESNDGYIAVDSQTVTKDTVGNPYSPGNLFLIEGWHEDGGYAKYHLGGKYKTMNFTLAVSSENPDNKAASEFTVYGDDDQILFTSGELDRATEPIPVGIEVKDQTWIYIRATGTDWYNVTFLMSNPVFYK